MIKEKVLLTKRQLEVWFPKKKRWSYFYPKMALFILGVAFAYLLFHQPWMNPFVETIRSWGYLGVLAVGALYAFSFAAPFAVALFLHLNVDNVLLASAVGAAGSLALDMILFTFSQNALSKKHHQKNSMHPIMQFKKLIENQVKSPFEKKLLLIIAALFIASPLPDEIGVTMLIGVNMLHKKSFMTMRYALHSFGIFALFLFRLSI